MIKVHIVGKGRWSNKIHRILSDSESTRYVPILHSVSDFRPEIIKNSNMEVIWLTLFSESQIEQINSLKQIGSKIILEKPYYLDYHQRLNFFRAISGFEERFWPSIPWQFGKPWLRFQASLKSDLQKLHIEITHKGEKPHHSIPMLIDWCSHDIHMLLQLFTIRLGKQPRINKVISKDCSILVSYENLISIEFSTEESSSREYMWKIQDGLTYREINFLDFKDRGEITQIHPIIKMLDNVVESKFGFSRDELTAVDCLLSAFIDSKNLSA